MKILCVSAQLPGHLDWGGYLATAATLRQRGHDVLWASGAAVAPLAERALVPFHGMLETGWRWPPPPPLTPDANTDAQTRQHIRQLRALDQWLEVERVAQATEELGALAAQFQPDLILSEMFVAAAALVAEQYKVPFVVVGWPAPSGQTTTGADLMVAVARKRQEELLDRFSLSGTNWTSGGPPALCSPRLHITYWSPSWFAGVETGNQTVHTGGLRPSIEFPQPDPTLPSPEDAPWALITLGTSFNVDPNFFIAATHAADQLGCVPLVALGERVDAPWVEKMRSRLPKSTVMRSHLDFDAYLPYVSAAVHHGGAGTTHALVVHAVPQIVVPHAADQMRQAQGIMRSGAGFYLPAKEVTVPRLVDALAQVIPDLSPIRAHTIALQAEFAALGGVPAAANQIEAMLR
jgi:UDP:flavonoid glycosyltransferase YjiC (YdhE family)